MALTQTQILPAPFIQAAAETYLPELATAVGGIKGLDVSQLYGPQFVAGPSAGQLQAELQAQQQLAFEQAYQPLKATQIYGAGIQPLISGYPGKEIQQQTPSPSPLQTALSIGGTLASIFGRR